MSPRTFTLNTRRKLALLIVLGCSPLSAHADVWDRCRPCLISIADLDGDGMRDLIVANRDATTRECVWLISSKSSAILQRVEGAHFGDGFGSSLAEIGDVNGDGVCDFAVGAVGTRDLQSLRGTDGRTLPPARVSGGYARVISGKTAATLFELPSGWNGEMDAFTVACGGDVNADGIPDVLVGDMHSQDTVKRMMADATDHGRVRVFSGANGAVLHVLVPPPLRRGGECFGISMAALGDLDHDGHGDFAVSAPFARLPSPQDDDPKPLNASEDGLGAVFVYSGRSGQCVRALTGTVYGEFGLTIASAKNGAHAGAYHLAIAYPSRTVMVLSTHDWSSRVIARSHCGVGYIDDFGSSLEFALDKKSGAATALAIGANEHFVPTFDEGYAEVYPIGEGAPLVLARDEKEGVDVCALDDLDGDGWNEYAFIAVQSMRVRVASGKSGETLREIVLRTAEPTPK